MMLDGSPVNAPRRSPIGSTTSDQRGNRSGGDPTDIFIERLAWLLDDWIPVGGGHSIGLDPLIGLVPGLGDVVSGLLSAVIIVKASQSGIPRSTVVRMVMNVAIDTVLGAIPVAGDFFDATFKANRRNVELYRLARTGAHRTTHDVLFLTGIVLLLLLILLIPLVLFWSVWQVVSGAFHA